MDVLTATLTTTFRIKPASLGRFVEVSYENEKNNLIPGYLDVNPMNESQIHLICEVLLKNDHFDQYTTFRHRMSALI